MGDQAMRKLLLSLLVLLMPVLAAAQINTLPSAPHLLVKGHAEVRVVPDRFTIDLTVDVTNLSPKIARKKVEAHMRQLFAALDAADALAGQTHASSLSIQPETDYRDSKTVFVGTAVSRHVSATFDSLDKLRAFIAHVPASKEVRISSTGVYRSDIDTIRLQLREAAIKNSKQAAKKIAAAYGLKLEGVYSVSEVAPDFVYGIQAGSWGPPATLQSVTVTGSTAPPDMAPPLPPPPTLRAGSMTLQQNIYAVYLTAAK